MSYLYVYVYMSMSICISLYTKGYKSMLIYLFLLEEEMVDVRLGSMFIKCVIDDFISSTHII